MPNKYRRSIWISGLREKSNLKQHDVTLHPNKQKVTKSDDGKVAENVGRQYSSHTTGAAILVTFSKNENIHTLWSTLGYRAQRNFHTAPQGSCTKMFITVWFMVRGNWKQPECPSVDAQFGIFAVAGCTKLGFYTGRKQQNEFLTQYHLCNVNTHTRHYTFYVQGHISTHRDGYPWWGGEGLWRCVDEVWGM